MSPAGNIGTGEVNPTRFEGNETFDNETFIRYAHFCYKCDSIKKKY